MSKKLIDQTQVPVVPEVVPSLVQSRATVIPRVGLESSVQEMPATIQIQSKNSKQLSTPIQDDTILGGYSNLGRISADAARSWGDSPDSQDDRENQTYDYGKMAAERFGGMKTSRSYADDGFNLS